MAEKKYDEEALVKRTWELLILKQWGQQDGEPLLRAALALARAEGKQAGLEEAAKILESYPKEDHEEVAARIRYYAGYIN